MTANELVEVGLKLLGAYFAVTCLGSVAIIVLAAAFFYWVGEREWS